MNLKNKLQTEIADQGQLLIKAASFQFLPWILIGGQVFVFWFSDLEHLFPGNDALMNVLGTCAEIIAGLYGITLAGYTFFLSRIDALMATDATLDYIVASIKQRCNSLLPKNVLSQIHENKGRHFEYTIALLQEQKCLPRSLFPDIRRIHRYYECMMNCTPLTVSQEMCILARKVLAALEQLPV